MTAIDDSEDPLQAAQAKAVAILNDLQGQQEEAERALAALDKQEDALAFAAQTGGVQAKERLARWEQKRETAATTLRRLKSSIVIATRHASAAQDALNAQAEVAKQEERLRLAETLGTRAERMDKLLADFTSEFEAFRADTVRAGRFGAVSIEASKRAIQTALLPIGMHSVSLPFAHRCTFSALTKNWAATIRNQATAAIGTARAILSGREAA